MRDRLVRNGLALAAGLCLVGGLGVARAQQPMPRPSAANMTSVYRGMNGAGAFDGFQQPNTGWAGNRPPISVYNNNSGFGTTAYSGPGANGPGYFVGNGGYGGYANGFNNGYANGGYGGYANGGYANGGYANGGYANGGYANGGYGGSANGFNNGFGGPAGNFGGWSLTNWPVPYAVPGATGNAYIQLPSYGVSGAINATDFGVARYGSYYNQVGAFGVPFARSFGGFSSFQGGGFGVGRGR